MSNAIVTENQLTGTPSSQWDLSGTNSSNIAGFATDISVNAGQTVNFKINTNSSNYRIDIYRLGYYQGNGARKVATSVGSGGVSILRMPSVQPAPVTNAKTGLVDAGNWSVSASWAIPATAVSGVYLAKLVRQDSTSGASHIVFVVRNDGVKHDIVFQTSDQTWHAYNGWGGFNLYGGGAGNEGDGRAQMVSYNRPFVTRDSVGTYAGPQDFVFSCEYPAIRWLEANGYDVCYMAGVDTDRNGSQLTNYKLFLSVGHDEYWSGNQRTNVENARAAGVHLAFWSGNEVFWKTRFTASTVTTDGSPTAYRTLVCYKETRDNAKTDPLDPPTWTGSWRDPRFSPPADGGRPENALTGTIFYVDSWRSDIITVPYPMTTLRFWRNCPLASTAPGSSASLVQDLLGYEWDAAPDNGFQPGGLVPLSSTTLSVDTYLCDYGATTGPGTATHNLTLYRDPTKGAIVFGAGTVMWAWGLDANHDLSGPSTDPNVQQAMVNLLADMGISPQTLQSGLVPATKSTDTTPPASAISAPANGASVQQNTTIVIAGSASDAGGGQVGVVEVSTDGGNTWHPATGTTSWSYSWPAPAPGNYTIKSRATDDSLNMETPGAGISVTITANPGLPVSLFNPSDMPFILTTDDPNAVEIGVQFQTSVAGTVSAIRFYKSPYNTGTHVASLWNASGTLLARATFTNETGDSWQQVNFASAVALTPGVTYVASYHTTVGQYSSDSEYFTSPVSNGPLTAPVNAGVYGYGSGSTFPTNTFNAENYWVDVVFNPGSAGGPPVANNDSGFVATENTALTIQASDLLANDYSPSGYALSIQSVSSPSNGTVVLNSGSPQTVTFTPTNGYTGSAGFTYTITDGHGGTASAQVSLTVNAPTGTGTSYSLFSASATPATVTVNDTNQVELGVQFQSSVAGKVTAIRFYKGSQNTGTHVGHLWSSTGTLLASVTFSGESSSGWQQATLATPVTITANTTYVVSYHCSGYYSATSSFFSNAQTNGPLTAPASSSISGGNGVYAYGSGTFPKNTYNKTNYWVDVVFVSN